MTKMLYSCDYSDNNMLFDGLKHEIDIYTLNKINSYGRDYYLCSYYDFDYELNSITLLTTIGDKLVNVPLSDYSSLVEYVSLNELESVSLDDVLIPDEIEVSETLNGDSFVKGINSKDNVLPFYEYVPVSPDGEVISGCVFEYSGLKDSNTQYCKTCCFTEKNNKLIHEAKIMGKNCLSMDSHFKLTVHDGDFGRIYSSNDNGNSICERVFLIPGERKYNVTFSKCLDYDMLFSFLRCRYYETTCTSDFLNYNFMDSCKSSENYYYNYNFTPFITNNTKMISSESNLKK